MPNWLPTAVRIYLAHTEGGAGIRALARAEGCHPSTVLRQVHRTENLRDDPLADSALARLGRLVRAGRAESLPFPAQDQTNMAHFDPIDDADLERDTLRALQALMEPRTLLVIAEGVEDAVVVHNTGADRPVRRAVVGRTVAESLVLRGLISGEASGRLARYTITPAGRAEATKLIAQSESRRAAASGLDADAETSGPDAAPGRTGAREAGRGRAARRRPVGADAPLHVLARRRRGDGTPYLAPELVAAAMRFRESFELAQMGGPITRDWESLLRGRISARQASNGAGPTRRLEAERSLAAAIRALGPDLSESVIRAVCHEEGMEEIEDRLDFPARSGKIVLRIALRTLARHYAATGSDGYDLIY